MPLPSFCRSRLQFFALLFVVAAAALQNGGLLNAAVGDTPRALDDRLRIALFASDPQIVTPVGIAVDRNGRLLVVESNTHFRPDDYTGHPTDRIVAVTDADGDGRADQFTTYADGFTHAMHITAHHDGSVYVATRGAVIRLRDVDEDGIADERTQLVELRTDCVYPHNGLFSVAFDFWGQMYISMGENLGEDYELVAADGAILRGGGEGGNIFRARPDGTQIEKIATGFWNPVQLHLDVFGRMFTVDNDPDSRPPCRFLHIVPGGDYGFRFRNGRKGLHPFTAWNGELPGTLPMIAGTGEAPSGLISCEYGILPRDYRGAFLVTSWGDHRIECFRLKQRGASFRADLEPIVSGGENFRPVGIAAAPDGSFYVTDWVDKSYDLHGKGRIWRIWSEDARAEGSPSQATAAIDSENRDVREAAARSLVAAGREGIGRLRQVAREHADARARATALTALAASDQLDPRTRDAGLADRDAAVRQLAARCAGAQLPDDKLVGLATSETNAQVRAELIRNLSGKGAGQKLMLAALGEEDPFVRTAARNSLLRARPAMLQPDDVLDRYQDPSQQVAVLLMKRAAGLKPGDWPRLLAAPSPDVRFVAIQWIAEEGLSAQRNALAEGLRRHDLSPRNFAATLAALAMLDGVPPQEADKTGGEYYLVQVLADPQMPAEVKVQALRRLSPSNPGLRLEQLHEFLDSPNQQLAVESVRSLRSIEHSDRQATLRQVVGDASRPIQLRAEAIVGLAGEREDSRGLLLKLANGDDPAVRNEALRSLRGAKLDRSEQESLQQLTQTAPDAGELVSRVLDPERRAPRPPSSDLEGWLDVLQGPADPQAGARIFLHPQAAGCGRCHRIQGRGGDFGPELTEAYRTLGLKRLAQSILEPSREVAPAFTSWQIVTVEGKVMSGLFVGEDAEGTQSYADSEGKLFRIPAADIESRRSHDKSIMPDGLAEQLTLQEFRDLLAFLRTSSGGEP